MTGTTLTAAVAGEAVPPATRSLPPRLRVAILGNSVPLLVVPSRTERSEGSYGEVLEATLRASGLDAEVANRSRLFELIHEGARRYGADVAPLQADVLVVHYGILELQPNVLPTRLNRVLSRRTPGGRGVRRVVQGHVAPRLWPAARGWQRWASARLGERTWRLRPDRFVAELDAIVRVARSTRALVLVVDVHEPGARLEHFLPGIGGRWRRFQDQLHGWVERHADPEVRLVAASDVVASLAGDGTADGLHLTAPAHALLAHRLAEEIATWRTGS